MAMFFFIFVICIAFIVLSFNLLFIRPFLHVWF